MELINAAQVEWLVINQPETEYYLQDHVGEYHLEDGFCSLDIERASISYEHYLSPETYNSLPQTFKDLAQ